MMYGCEVYSFADESLIETIERGAEKPSPAYYSGHLLKNVLKVMAQDFKVYHTLLFFLHVGVDKKIERSL